MRLPPLTVALHAEAGHGDVPLVHTGGQLTGPFVGLPRFGTVEHGQRIALCLAVVGRAEVVASQVVMALVPKRLVIFYRNTSLLL